MLAAEAADNETSQTLLVLVFGNFAVLVELVAEEKVLGTLLIIT